jgi:ATP-dependent protease ClpP protease subunit
MLDYSDAETHVGENALNTVKGNKVFIYGSFDESIAKDVIPALLEEVEKQKTLKAGTIKFYIDSNGGYARYLYDLLAIVETAKKLGVTVETYVFSYAYSCGSVLACAGTKGNRFISVNAEHLCHLGSASTGVVANDVELERGSDRVKNHFDKIRALYKKYAAIKNLEEAIKNDNYFIRGNDIIKNGLADKMVD